MLFWKYASPIRNILNIFIDDSNKVHKQLQNKTKHNDCIVKKKQKKKKTREKQDYKKKVIKQYYCGTLAMIPSCSEPIQPLEATCAFLIFLYH